MRLPRVRELFRALVISDLSDHTGGPRPQHWQTPIGERDQFQSEFRLPSQGHADPSA